jgi:hypothetical protein
MFSNLSIQFCQNAYCNKYHFKMKGEMKIDFSKKFSAWNFTHRIVESLSEYELNKFGFRPVSWQQHSALDCMKTLQKYAKCKSI